MEERYTEIEKENRLLLDKMTTILAQRGSAPGMTSETGQNFHTISTTSYIPQRNSGSLSPEHNVLPSIQQ